MAEPTKKTRCIHCDRIYEPTGVKPDHTITCCPSCGNWNRIDKPSTDNREAVEEVVL